MMAEMSEEDDWAAKLRAYNSRHNPDRDEEEGRSPLEEGGNSEEDKKLLEEYYIKFKGEATNKYSAIPKFYSKVYEEKVTLML